MIPGTNKVLNTTFNLEMQPSRTYQMNLKQNSIINYCDEIEAMKQVIYKIINTERYQYIIYSWNYGIELLDLFGEPISYVCPELERRITEALTQDERILSVDAFSFDTSVKRQVHVSFNVHTIFGDIVAERMVDI